MCFLIVVCRKRKSKFYEKIKYNNATLLKILNCFLKYQHYNTIKIVIQANVDTNL
jgi:hypothetical protein